jgi:hypothetical protein
VADTKTMMDFPDVNHVPNLPEPTTSGSKTIAKNEEKSEILSVANDARASDASILELKPMLAKTDVVILQCNAL